MTEHGSAAAVVEAMRNVGGGWWRALPARDILALYTATDETYYRAHHTYMCSESDNADFSHARPAYILGHIAGLDPEYAGRAWSEIEPELARGWTAVTGEVWQDVAQFARSAFVRAAAAKDDSLRARLASSDAAWNAA